MNIPTFYTNCVTSLTRTKVSLELITFKNDSNHYFSHISNLPSYKINYNEPNTYSFINYPSSHFGFNFGWTCPCSWPLDKELSNKYCFVQPFIISSIGATIAFVTGEGAE